MGYIYGYKSKKLCCDCCGEEGARKRACPHGYCPSPALCAKCNEEARTDGRWAKAHAGCKANHDAFVARNNREAALLASGAFVRCSALNSGNLVHVLFENNRGETIGKLMTHDTYAAFPLIEPVTVEDYSGIVTLMDGPNVFDFGGASKTAEEMFA